MVDSLPCTFAVVIHAGETRFATNIIMLERVVDMHKDLKNAANSSVWADHLPKPNKARGAVPAQTAAAPARPSSSRAKQPTAKAAATQAAAQAAQAVTVERATAAAKPAEAAKRVMETINDEALYNSTLSVVDMCQPIVRLLRLADSGEIGHIGKLYYRWYQVTELWCDALAGLEEARDKAAAFLVSSRMAETVEDAKELIPELGEEQAATIKMQASRRWEHCYKSLPSHEARYRLHLLKCNACNYRIHSCALDVHIARCTCM